MLKIRLARFGRKKLPHYKIVVAQNTAPRHGRFIEQIGTYSPLLDKADCNRLKVDKERFSYWVSVGAKPTQRIAKFLQTT